MKNTPSPRKRKIYTALFLVALLLALALSLLDALASPHDPLGLLPLAVRVTAATAILLLLLSERMLFLCPHLPRDGLIVGACLFIFLIALNNFPFLDLLTGRTSVTVTPIPLLVFIANALATAAFEELLFRGLLFPLVCARIIKREGKRESPRPFGGLLPPILLASALFSLLHLVNLTVSPVGDTLLQVAYTFGIGILSTLLYLFSRSLLLPFAFHALYNFGGLFLSAFGGVNDPALGTVISTAALALLTAVLAAFALSRFSKNGDFTN